MQIFFPPQNTSSSSASSVPIVFSVPWKNLRERGTNFANMFYVIFAAVEGGDSFHTSIEVEF